MKTHVIYYSRTGFTKRYADWIAEDLGVSTAHYKDRDKLSIAPGDLVIFGSYVHAGKILYLDKMRERFKSHQNFICFATGGAPYDETVYAKHHSANFPQNDKTPFFYFSGGVSYERMGFIDRSLMKTFAKLMAGRNNLTPEDAYAAKMLQNSYDMTSREFINPLVECARGMA